MFRVFRTEWYEKKFSKLDNSERMVVEKFEQSLKINPFAGKPLRYDFLREKKFGGKRLIYLIYEDELKVFLVTISDKKSQASDIDFVASNLEVFKKEFRFLLLFLQEYL